MSDSRAETAQERVSLVRVLLKATLIFVALNILFALLDPLPLIGRLTLHNGLLPGRTRLPFGEDERAYNLSLNSLDAMFATHTVAQPKAVNEFRVLLIGDSSTWGVLLRPKEALAGQINRDPMTLDDGRVVRVYNLGHPVLSLTKDLLILDYAMRYQPDMIVWLTTLRSFPRDKQFFAPIVQNNAGRVRELFQTYNLDYDLQDSQLIDPDFMEQTLVGQRRALADWLRLQLYGIMWTTTGIDQYYPEEITLRTSDFDDNIAWQDIAAPRELNETDLAFDILEAGHTIADTVPVLLVNEPIFISDGQNSNLRYNLWYPRWAYNSYRQRYQSVAQAQGWQYLDLWDVIDPDEFTDSPVHLTADGSQQLAGHVRAAILDLAIGDTPNNG